MQERVLGSIIMGSIALLGVVWAVIEGVPPLVNAKKEEKQLEEKIVTVVKDKFDASVEELDIKRVSFITRDDRVPGGRRPKLRAIISLEGVYNNKNDEYFKVALNSSNDYIIDLQNKIGPNEVAPHMSIEYDIYQNYSMTLSNLLIQIVEDETTVIESYATSEGLYTRLYLDSGCTINAINKEADNPNNLTEYTVAEAIEATKNLKYGEKTEEEFLVTGVVKSIESKKDTSTKVTYYTLTLETEGSDELHQFEVYSAKLLNSTVKEKDLVVGATVVCKGKLSTNMAYTKITKE